MRRVLFVLTCAALLAACSSEVKVVKTDTTPPPESSAVTTTTDDTATTVAKSTTTTGAAPSTTAMPPASTTAGALPAKITILAVQAGAGSGEMTILVDRKPPGWTRYKVSLDGPSGPSVRATILDVADSPSGVYITVLTDGYTGGIPLTVAVSWVNGDGVTSAIAYATCSAGIPLSGSC